MISAQKFIETYTNGGALQEILVWRLVGIRINAVGSKYSRCCIIASKMIDDTITSSRRYKMNENG